MPNNDFPSPRSRVMQPYVVKSLSPTAVINEWIVRVIAWHYYPHMPIGKVWNNNNNNNNNVRLLNCWHTAQLTILGPATQGGTIYRRVKPTKLLPQTAHSDWINRTGLTCERGRWKCGSGKCRSEKYRSWNIWKAVHTESSDGRSSNQDVFDCQRSTVAN